MRGLELIVALVEFAQLNLVQVFINAHPHHQVQKRQYVVQIGPGHHRRRHIHVAAHNAPPCHRGQAKNGQQHDADPDHGGCASQHQQDRHRQHVEPNHGSGVDATRVHGRINNQHHRERSHRVHKVFKNGSDANHRKQAHRQHRHHQIGLRHRLKRCKTIPKKGRTAHQYQIDGEHFLAQKPIGAKQTSPHGLGPFLSLFQRALSLAVCRSAR